MKYFLLFFCFLLLSVDSNSYAQESEQLIPYRKGKLWGYSNMAGDLVIPIVYSSTEPFVNGIARVSKDHKYGVINKKNEILIPFKYENYLEPECATLSEREIEYLKKEAVGVERVNDFFSKVFIAAYGKEHIIKLVNAEGQFISDKIYSSYSFMANGRFKRKATKLPDLHIASKGKKLGLLNNKGREVSAFDYDKIIFNQNATFTVEKDSLFAFLDTLGNEITPFEYIDIAKYFALPSDCWVVTRQDGLKAVINEKGEIIFTFKYANLNRFYEKIVCTKINDKYGLVDSLGNIIPGFESEHPIAMFKEYLILVKNEKYGLDRLGREGINTIYL